MTELVQTPPEALEGLPDFPFASTFTDFDGVRMAHLDEGDGPPVVFVHGEPTWSFLWRKVLVPVRDAGYRCIAPDLPGFGRSDKPTDIDWYTYDRHTAALTALLDELDVTGATWWSTTGAARSACAPRWSPRSASTGWSSSTPACSPAISR